MLTIGTTLKTMKYRKEKISRRKIQKQTSKKKKKKEKKIKKRKEIRLSSTSDLFIVTEQLLEGFGHNLYFASLISLK